MLRNLGIIFILLVSIFVPFFQNNTAPVQAASENLTQDPDAALCLPGMDSMDIEDCLQAGPDARLKELASQGITFPEKPIVAGKTPRDLATVPFQYGIVTPEETELFRTRVFSAVTKGSLPHKVPGSSPMQPKMSEYEAVVSFHNAKASSPL